MRNSIKTLAILSIGLLPSLGFAQQASPTPNKKTPVPLSHFENGKTRINPKFYLENAQELATGVKDDENEYYIFSVSGKKYLYVVSEDSQFQGHTMPTVSDKLYDISDNLNAENLVTYVKTYNDAKKALEPLQEGYIKFVTDITKSVPNDVELSKEKKDELDNKIKTEQKSVEAKMGEILKGTQFSVENGNMVFGSEKRVLISKYDEVVKKDEFKAVGVDPKITAKELMLRTLLLSTKTLDDSVVHAQIIYEDSPGTMRTNSFDFNTGEVITPHGKKNFFKEEK